MYMPRGVQKKPRKNEFFGGWSMDLGIQNGAKFGLEVPGLISFCWRPKSVTWFYDRRVQGNDYFQKWIKKLGQFMSMTNNNTYMAYELSNSCEQNPQKLPMWLCVLGCAYYPGQAIELGVDGFCVCEELAWIPLSHHRSSISIMMMIIITTTTTSIISIINHHLSSSIKIWMTFITGFPLRLQFFRVNKGVPKTNARYTRKHPPVLQLEEVFCCFFSRCGDHRFAVVWVLIVVKNDIYNMCLYICECICKHIQLYGIYNCLIYNLWTIIFVTESSQF